MRVLIGNDPQAYREGFAAVLGALRPEIEVITVTPAELDTAIVCHAPDFVVCSDLTSTVETRPLGWVLLYPDGSRTSVLAIRGERSTVAHMELETLLAALDGIAE